MRGLSRAERLVLERTVGTRALWIATEDELAVAADLHRQGLLGRVEYLGPDGLPWWAYPAIEPSERALRIDRLVRELGGGG